MASELTVGQLTNNGTYLRLSDGATETGLIGPGSKVSGLTASDLAIRAKGKLEFITNDAWATPAVTIQSTGKTVHTSDTDDSWAFQTTNSNANGWGMQISAGDATSGRLALEVRKNTNETAFKVDCAGLVTAYNGINLGNTVSATATTLDGYEEGTFTVSIASGAGTLSLESGEYTRIGNCVFVRIAIRVSVNMDTNILAGLPFIARFDGATSGWMPLGPALTSSESDQTIIASCLDDSSLIHLFDQSKQGDAHFPNTVNEYYRFCGFYYTTEDFN